MTAPWTASRTSSESPFTEMEIKEMGFPDFDALVDAANKRFGVDRDTTIKAMQDCPQAWRDGARWLRPQ